jgi:hypothetical protein
MCIMCNVLLYHVSFYIRYVHVQSEFADTAAYAEVKKSLEVSHDSRLRHYFHILYHTCLNTIYSEGEGFG